MLEFDYEDKFRSGSQYRIICGVDEAGRGPLAGPVVAAACVLNAKTATEIDGLNDSKLISEKKREYVYEAVTKAATSWCAAMASVEEIDNINILNATLLAMNRAIAGLSVSDEEFCERDIAISGIIARGGTSTAFGNIIVPDLALIDGNSKKSIFIDAVTIVKGDKIVPSIAAASIIAKVTRDRMCMEMHERYPEYGFDRHKGYSTKEHMQKVIELGATPIHRKSFLGFVDKPFAASSKSKNKD